MTISRLAVDGNRFERLRLQSRGREEAPWADRFIAQSGEGRGVDILIGGRLEARAANREKDEINLTMITNPLAASRWDVDDIADADRFGLQPSDLDDALSGQDQIALDDALKPVQPGRDARFDPGARDGNGGVVRAVPRLQDETALDHEVLIRLIGRMDNGMGAAHARPTLRR